MYMQSGRPSILLYVSRNGLIVSIYFNALHHNNTKKLQHLQLGHKYRHDRMNRLIIAKLPLSTDNT